MSLFTSVGRTKVPDRDDAGIAAWISKVADQFDLRTALLFATTAERDARLAGDLHPSKISPGGGLRCWVTNRSGWSTWTGAGWIWEPQRNLLYDWSWEGPADVVGSGGSFLRDTQILELPPGQRIVSVSIQANAQPVDGSSGGARLWVDGPGCQGVAQQPVLDQPASDRDRTHMSRQWDTILVTGPQRWQMRALVQDPEGINAIRFTDMKFTIIDHGPAGQ